MRFAIEFEQEAEEELARLDPYDQNTIIDSIETSLRYEPLVVSRNRKPVVPVGVLADTEITWQLRVGDFRVFYDVRPQSLVVVIRIVRKGSKTTEGSLK